VVQKQKDENVKAAESKDIKNQNTNISEDKNASNNPDLKKTSDTALNQQSKDTPKDKKKSSQKKNKSYSKGIFLIILLMIIGALGYGYDQNIYQFKNKTHALYNTYSSIILPDHKASSNQSDNVSADAFQDKLEQNNKVTDTPLTQGAAKDAPISSNELAKSIKTNSNIMDKQQKDNQDNNAVQQDRSAEQQDNNVVQEVSLQENNMEIAQPDNEGTQSNTTKSPTSSQLENQQIVAINAVQKAQSDRRQMLLENTNLFLTLVQKVNNGEAYLDALIDLKMAIKGKDVALPVLTDYAHAGFPTDMIIIDDTMKILKRLVILQSRKKSVNTFEDILSKFVIVTPVSAIQGFSGALNEIKKGVHNSDFGLVMDEINTLPVQQQKSFAEIKAHIENKNEIQSELFALNQALINVAFDKNQINQ